MLPSMANGFHSHRGGFICDAHHITSGDMISTVKSESQGLSSFDTSGITMIGRSNAGAIAHQVMRPVTFLGDPTRRNSRTPPKKETPTRANPPQKSRHAGPMSKFPPVNVAATSHSAESPTTIARMRVDFSHRQQTM